MYNPHLNPMSPAEFESDPLIAGMRAKWSAETAPGSFALGRLRIALTQKCNFACPFCYNEGSPGITESLTPDDLAFLLDAALPFTRSIKLTGGEPLAHRSFDRIARECSSRRPTSVTTNGSLLMNHREALGFMSSVTVSIQSIDPARYAGLMGTSHSVEKVLRDIQFCIAETGVPFQINCVVTRGTWEGLLPLCRSAESIGVSQVNLLGMLKLAEEDTADFVPYATVADMLSVEYGSPELATSTRIRFRSASGLSIDLVYQYCSVGCDVCRTDGFIRIDPTLALSYCLAATPIPVRHLVKQRDHSALREAFAVAMGLMGSPDGKVPPIVRPRARLTSATKVKRGAGIAPSPL